MQHELLPKACIVIALLLGSGGIVSYVTHSAPEGSAAENAKAKLRRENIDDRVSATSAQPGNTLVATQQSNTDATTKLQRETPRESSTEAVYYCGAMTRKGTPCTRRLKTKGRCWQHAGQPLAENEVKQSLRR